MGMKMKKLAVLGLTVIMCVAGCQKPSEEPALEKEPEIIVEEVVDEEETEEIVEETEEIPLSIHTVTNNKTYYFEGGEDAYLYLQYCDVYVEGNEYSKLKRNVENWSLERSEGLRSLYASFEESAGETAEGEETFYGFSLYQDIITARADEAMVSLLDDMYQYTGLGDHIFYREGINFDAKSGQRLKLEDLVYDYEAFSEDAKERIVYELREEFGDELYDDYIGTVEGLWAEASEPEWYADATGIVIVIQENSVGPQSIGTTQIHLPYVEFETYIKEEYIPGSTIGVAALEKNQELFLRLPGIEEEMPMMVVCETQEEGMYQSIWLGQNELKLDDFLVLEDAYIVRTGEDVYCLLEVDFASDDYVTYIFRLTEGVLEKTGEVEAAVDNGNINSEKISMEFWVNILGTYGGVKEYHFEGNGKFVTEDQEYELYRNEFVLTTKTELPIMLDEDEMESILPAGSHIILNATDGENYVKFTIQETGQSGMLNVERDSESYMTFVNGMEESECFELLPYAG